MPPIYGKKKRQRKILTPPYKGKLDRAKVIAAIKKVKKKKTDER